VNHKLPMIAIAALALAGCGSSNGTSTAGAATSAGPASSTTLTTASRRSETTAASTADVAFNDADVTFAQNMIPHHEQAITMADLALDPTSGAGPEVSALAGRIKAAQGPEVEMMSGWLDSWGQPAGAGMGHEGHGMGSMDGMSGMMSSQDMARLADARGPQFDQLWLELMVEHHQGAIDMARSAKADASDPEVIDLADAVITAQDKEIQEMTLLLAG
jgi:uncharacterized protein (DUF305 family)